MQCQATMCFRVSGHSQTHTLHRSFFSYVKVLWVPCIFDYNNFFFTSFIDLCMKGLMQEKDAFGQTR